MAHDTLKVDHEKLAQAGGRLGEHADSIPEPPAPFTVSGSDPLSSAVAAQIPTLEEPIL
jgi:hypothetical protein